MTSREPSPEFAPADLTDGRHKGDWQTKYTDPVARWWIRFEAFYLMLHLFLTPCLIVVFCAQWPLAWINGEVKPEVTPRVSQAQYDWFLRYWCAWLGGTFGGTLFSMKWLYHSVAKQSWHEDRRLWRLFTPPLSGGLACSFLVLMSCGLLSIFDVTALDDKTRIVGMSFLVGYFSDTAIGKLADIADTLFGRSKKAKTE